MTNWTTPPSEIDIYAVMEDIPSAITLHVLTGTKAIYKATEDWREFNIVE